MNNQWTERFTGKTRFRAEKVAPRTVVIRDARNPKNNSWSMDYATPLLNVTRDYALILRVVDPNTDEPVYGSRYPVFGTLAASEFLTKSSGSQRTQQSSSWMAGQEYGGCVVDGGRASQNRSATYCRRSGLVISRTVGQ